MQQKQQKRTQEQPQNQQHQVATPCKYCGCETNEDIIKAAIWTEKGLIVIEDIPAQLCEGCGEQFFDEQVTQKIQQAIKYPAKKAKQQLQVPVCSLSQLEVEKGKRHSETTEANLGRQDAFLCRYCESQTTEEMVKSAFWVDGQLVAIENVPAKVCQRCRQQFYDQETAEKITTLDKRSLVAVAPNRKVLVPVFSLAELEKPPGECGHRQ